MTELRREIDEQLAPEADFVRDVASLFGGGAVTLTELASRLLDPQGYAHIAHEALAGQDQARALEVGQQQLFGDAQPEIRALEGVHAETARVAGLLGQMLAQTALQAEIQQKTAAGLVTLVAISERQQVASAQAALAAEEAEHTARRLAILAIAISVVGLLVGVALQAVSVAVQLGWHP